MHQYCSHSHVHPWALHLPTLFTSGQTDVSRIGLELVNWITHTYCIHAVGLCFPLGHAAEHQCHSEELALADVSPQNCSNHDSQNGADSCLASLFMSICKTPSKHSMCFFSNSFCLFKLTIKLLWHLSSSCARDTMPHSASGDSRAAVGCSGTCQGSDMLPWVGYRGSKQDSVLEASTSSEKLQHSCTWAMDCFFLRSSMTLI